MVGRVGQLPLGGLDVDRHARERRVLAGVVGMQVAVRDRGHVVDPNPAPASASSMRSRLRVVRLLELGIPEAQPGVEQEHAAAMPNGIPDDHTPPPVSAGSGNRNVPYSIGMISGSLVTDVSAPDERASVQAKAAASTEASALDGA